MHRNRIACFRHVSSPKPLKILTRTFHFIYTAEHSGHIMELWSSLPLCKVPRRLVWKFGGEAALLNKNLCESQMQHFGGLTNNVKKIIRDIKCKTGGTPVLAILRLQGVYNVNSNAWKKHIRCFFLQKQTHIVLGQLDIGFNFYNLWGAPKTPSIRNGSQYSGIVADLTLPKGFPVYRLGWSRHVGMESIADRLELWDGSFANKFITGRSGLHPLS